MASIGTLINQPHDQVITGLSGVYTGTGSTDLAAPNPSTSGPNKGWLTLAASSPGAVQVHFDNEIHLGSGNWRIRFIGFNFSNPSNALTAGFYMNGATDVQFWWCDFTNPIDPSELNTSTANGAYRPRVFYPWNGTQCRFYGCTMHDMGSTTTMSAGDTVYFEGSRIYNVGPSDPLGPPNGTFFTTARWHADGLGTTANGGTIANLTLVDSVVEDRILIDSSKLVNGAAGHSNVNIQNGWVNSNDGVGFDLIDRVNCPTPSIEGTWRNLYIFNTKGAPRIDQNRTGASDSTPPFTDTTYIKINDDSSVHYGVTPPAGTSSPHDVWRSQNPYASWQTFPAFDDLPQGPTGTTWKSRMGLSPGAWEGNFTSSQMSTDLANLQLYGDWLRYPLYWSGATNNGWSTSNRTAGFGTADTAVAQFVNAGTHKLILCLLSGANPYNGSIDNAFPTSANQTAWADWCTDVATRYTPGNGHIPADGDVWFEIWNEPNINSGIDPATGHPNFVAYAQTYDTAYNAIKAVSSSLKVMPAGPAPSDTNVNDGSSNRFGYTWDGTANKRYSPFDWYDNLFNDPGGLLGAVPKINGHFDGLGIHPYSSSQGPLGTHGTMSSTVAAYNFNAAREMFLIQVDALFAGNAASKCLFNATEAGYDTAPYWTAGESLVVGDKRYGTKGSLNASWAPESTTQNRWSRGARYRCTTAHVSSTSNQPPNASFWALEFAGGGTQGADSSGNTAWDAVSGSSIYEENEQGQAYTDLLAIWFNSLADADGHKIGQYCNIITFYQNRDLVSPTTAGTFNGHMGMVDRNGREKGSPASAGSLEVLKSLSQTPLQNVNEVDDSVRFPIGAFVRATGTKAITGASALVPVGTTVGSSGTGSGKQVVDGSALIPVGLAFTATGTVQFVGPAQTVKPPFDTAPGNATKRFSEPRRGSGRRSKPKHPFAQRRTTPVHPPS